MIYKVIVFLVAWGLRLETDMRASDSTSTWLLHLWLMQTVLIYDSPLYLGLFTQWYFNLTRFLVCLEVIQYFDVMKHQENCLNGLGKCYVGPETGGRGFRESITESTLHHGFTVTLDVPTDVYSAIICCKYARNLNTDTYVLENRSKLWTWQIVTIPKALSSHFLILKKQI